MIIDCISDLHGHYPKLEGGDLLIVAGDLTARDTLEEHLFFIKWAVRQEYNKVIYIAGNHDNRCLKESAKNKKVEYLCDSGTEFEGLKIWGSPWTKMFDGLNPKCMAFTCDTEEELEHKWALIPDDTDILITHSPEYGLLDEVVDEDCHERIRHCGSISLGEKTANLKNLKLHVVGHIHEGYGVKDAITFGNNMYKYVNCSHVNERYQPVNKPIRVIL
jgi:Icc-related predicted phosphoesterase